MIGEFSIGVSLWQTPPIQHEVTRVLLSITHKCLVTGALDGHILYWTFEESQFDKRMSSEDLRNSSQLKLEMVLVGTKSPITGLAACSYQGMDTFVSVSYDGTVCIWSFEEGKCLASSEKLLSCAPTSLVVLPSGYHFACSGNRDFNDIVIVSLRNMEVSVTIPAYPNNVTSLFCCDLGAASVLVSAGVDGIVQFWSLRKGESHQPALQTACLEIGEALSIAISPNYRSMLVVTAKQWMLYSAKEFVDLMSVNAPDGTAWAGGDYITSRTALVYSNAGIGYLYVLPDLSRTPPFSFVPEDYTTIKIEDEYIDLDSYSDVEVKAQPNFRLNFLKKLNLSTPVHRPLCSFVLNEDVPHGSGLLHRGGVFQNYFVVGDENGILTMWKLPPRDKRIDPSLKIKPFACQSSAKAFFQEEGKEKSERVTASTILEKLMWLALGYDSGKLCLGKLPAASTSHFELENAHTGKISTLLSWMQGPKRYLLSGGDDRYIKVWNIKDDCSFTPLWTFFNHSGPILQLFKPPLNNVPQGILSAWKSRIFSIAQDKTVCLFSLDTMTWKHTFGPHPNFVVDVRWNIEQDYLLVKCQDNSVSVWEIGTGLLENVVYGSLALEILENGVQVLPKENKSIQHLDKAINSTTINMSGNTPIQMIFVNTRLFIKAFHKITHKRPSATSFDAPLSVTSGNINPFRLSAYGNANVGGAQIHSPRVPIFSNSQFTLEQYAAYKCLSYLIPWHLDKQLDIEIINKLQLIRPDPNFSYGVSGAGGNMTIFVPRKEGKVKLPSHFATLLAITIVASFQSLLQIAYFKQNTSELIKKVSHQVAEQLSVINPSLTLLARYWRDSSEEITQAARLIFSVCSVKVPAQERDQLVEEWANYLKGDSSEARVHAILGLGVLGSEIPDSLKPDLTKQVVEELVKVLSNKNESTVLRTAAAELLGKGYKNWKVYLNKSVDTLIHTLFSLSLTQNGEPTSSTSTMAHQALLAIGAAEPKRFVIALGTYILEVHNADTSHGKNHDVKHHAAAIATLGALIRNEPFSLLPMLPRVVETVVQSLDPHVPSLRDICLPETTKVLHTLVKQYPTVSFHQDTQRLAVGTKEGVIVIYDLKTATRSHVLEGHSGSISCIAFSENGKQIVSYSIFDSTVRIWQTTSSFWGPIIGSTPRCTKVIPVNTPEGTVTDINPLESIRIRFSSVNYIELSRSWEGTLTLKI